MRSPGFDHERFGFDAIATLIVWVMTLFIARSNRRDTLAIHAKLDELLRSDANARAELTTLDQKQPEVIAKHRDAEVRAMKRS
jgi:low affinity Fe/Cu permease